MAKTLSSLKVDKQQQNNFKNSVTVMIDKEDSIIKEKSFTDKLHAVLDFYKLFDTFIHDLRKELPCDGIKFQESKVNLSFVDGNLEKNRSSYNIKYKGQVLGDICFSRKKAFLKSELEMIENMVAGLIVPLHNALLYQYTIFLAQHDELTGLRNGSYYYDFLRLEIERAHRYKTPFSILLINLNGLRELNEKHSHAAGDTALIYLAKKIEHDVRSCDMVFRDGGDNFLIFLPNANESNAMTVAERIKKTAMSCSCVYNDQNIYITLSAGIATVLPEDTVFNLITRLDKSLSHAKITEVNLRQIEDAAAVK